MRRHSLLGCALLGMIGVTSVAWSQDSSDSVLTKAIRDVESRVLDDEQRKQAPRMLGEYYSARIKAANAQSTADWRGIKSLADWQKFRQEKLTALKASLGRIPEFPQKQSPVWHMTKQIEGDGFVIKCVLFESRPGIWVSGNLYSPAQPKEPMPGFVISHSHHTSKTHGELQDMGMTWARMGCVVFVPDHLGHGERRQHPFATERDYPGSFRVSRQDYYFRYDLAMQAHLAGESFVGQLAYDLSLGVDLVLAQPGVDAKRIALLGAVAGGGDPAAMAAALDERISVAVPFNFGGPQPETTFPLPDDAEAAFNFAGSGSWESTRNLKYSAHDGFLPWVIVGSIAPRSLIYAHEFAWDKARDPVWTRLQTISQWQQPPSGLSETHGYGSVKHADGSHCTHIGKLHRVAIHKALSEWFHLPGGAVAEYSQRRESSELLCWTDEWQQRLKPRTYREVLDEKVTLQLGSRRRRTATPSIEQQREAARKEWSRLLFDAADAELIAHYVDGTKPISAALVKSRSESKPLSDTANYRVETFQLESEQGISVPAILLTPTADVGKKVPVVVVVSQSGKAVTLDERAPQIARLLSSGCGVCVCDLRGIGESSVGSDRDRSGEMTSRAASQLMLGGSVVGKRLRDLLAVLQHLKQQPGVDARKLAVWGDSNAPTNARDAQLVVPHAIDKRPRLSEPTGQLLAVLAALFDDDVTTALGIGGLRSFQSVLNSPAVFVPYDAVIADMLTLGDVDDLSQVLLPSQVLRLAALRTSGNQTVDEPEPIEACIDELINRMAVNGK